MDEVLRALQLTDVSEAAQLALEDELWNLLIDSPVFGLRELIEEVGIDLSEARQVLTDARVGDSPALLLIVLGRREEVREALLRMRHGHY
jgi:hypothetical protein